MKYDSYDLKVDVINYLEENEIVLPENLIDYVVENLEEKLDESTGYGVHNITERRYRMYIRTAVKDIMKAFKGMNLSGYFADESTLEDDYSEDSGLDHFYSETRHIDGNASGNYQPYDVMVKKKKERN